MVNASRPSVIFCCGKTGCEEQNEKFNLMDVSGVGQVCLGSRFGRFRVPGCVLRRPRKQIETTIGGCLGTKMERETMGVDGFG